MGHAQRVIEDGDVEHVVSEKIDLTSALFQSSVWLESAYPKGSMEHQIADVCWQAFEAYL